MSNNILKNIVFGCLFAILISPLLIWSKFFFPYITFKTIYFRILVEIALFFYILLVFYRPQLKPCFTPLTSVIVIYVFVMTVASVLGLNLYRSFWGNVERGEGLLTVYHIIIFFILLTSTLKTKQEWFRFFNIAIFISLLESFYAFSQKLGLSFVYHFGGGRLDGTIGNASFLAAYLLLNIFLCILLFVNKKDLRWRIYYSLVCIFEIYILFNTATRGAILGFFGGLIIFGILSIILAKNRKMQFNFVILIVILLMLAGIVYISRGQTWIKKIPGMQRIVTISTQDITTQSRLLTWNASWRGWKDRLIFGYGYENFNIAFNKYFPVQIYRDPGSQIWFDRAHNVIFDQAVCGGIFGLLSYLGIYIIAIWTLWRARNNKQGNHNNNQLQQPLSSIILISLLAAYLFQNLFVFDVLASYISIYAIFGFIGFIYMSNRKEYDLSPNESKFKKNKPSKFIVFILIIIFIFISYFFNFRLAITNYQGTKAMAYGQYNMFKESIDQYKIALAHNNNQASEIRQNLVNTVVTAINSNKLTVAEQAAACEYALSQMQKNIELSPDDAYGYLFISRLYADCARYDQKRYELALDAGKKALELSPTRPQIYYQMGQAAAVMGQNDISIDYFKKAVELSPDVAESHWNLASVYIIFGKDELADKEFEKLKEIGFEYFSMDNLQRLVRPYLIVKNYTKIIFLYEEMIKLEPNRADLYAQLAAAYKEIGEIEKAKTAVKKAIELDSSFKEEGEAFIKLLEEK